MEIKHLTYFQKALKSWDSEYASQSILSHPLELVQIEVIEKTIYQKTSQKLPEVLRELLLLTGGFCPIFDTGANLSYDKKDSLDEKDLFNEQNKNPYFSYIKEHNKLDRFFKNRLIWSFFTVYESSRNFSFIYLDEDEDDPIVYSFDTDEFYRDENSTDLISDDIGLYYGLKKVKIRLKQLITKVYKEHCMMMISRPPFNAKIAALYKEGYGNHLHHQNTFYTLVSNRDLSGVKYFIESGIDVTANNNRAIIETAKTNDPEIFDLLLATGANPYDQDEKILELAIKRSHWAITGHLIKKLKFTQNSMDRAFVELCSLNWIGLNLAKQLIQKGANINAFNTLGFQIAIRKKEFSFASILVSDYGANYKVNSGFVLLFKDEMSYHTEKIIPTDIQLLHPIGTILKQHEIDLRDFYGANYDEKLYKIIFSNIKSKMEKSKRNGAIHLNRKTSIFSKLWTKLNNL